MVVREHVVAFIPDRCIGCRACQVACKIWNDRKPEETSFSPTFTNPQDLSPDTYTIIRFKEVEIGGQSAWVYLKLQCMHCKDAPCARACPAGAIDVHPEGAVVIRPDKCIGCQYCVEACPYNIPRYDPKTNKVYKCTMCIDRIQNGLQPSCVQACPTQALVFGVREELLSRLHSEGYEVYGDNVGGSVGYTHWVYATKKYRGKLKEWFDLPEKPTSVVELLEVSRLGGLGIAGLVAAGALLHAIYWRMKRASELGRTGGRKEGGSSEKKVSSK